MVPQMPDIFPVKAQIYPQHTNRVSAIGHPCWLSNYFARTRWEDQKPIDPVLAKIFKVGYFIQGWAMAQLHTLETEGKLTIVAEEKSIQWEEYQLTGRCDLVVIIDDTRVHLDIKSCSSIIYPRLNTLGDLRSSQHHYHRGYVTQASLYASHPAIRCEWTGLLLVNKVTFENKTIMWKTSEAKHEMDNAFDACAQINHAIKKHDPKHLENPGDYCTDCRYSHLCDYYNPAAKCIEVAPEEIEQLITARTMLKTSKAAADDELKEIEGRLKAYWDSVEPGQHHCGAWIALVKEVPEKEVSFTKRAHRRVSYKEVTA